MEPDIDMDFQGLADTAALLADTRFAVITGSDRYQYGVSVGVGGPGGSTGATTEITLDTTVGVAALGHTKSMKYAFNHGDNGATSLTISREVTFTEKQEVWAEWVMKYSPNFTTEFSGTAGAAYPNDHKLIFGDTVADLSERWGLKAGNQGPSHIIALDYPLGSWGGGSGTNVVAGVNMDAIWALNIWLTWRMHIKHSTTISSNDARWRIWVGAFGYTPTLIHNATGFNTWKDDLVTRERIHGFSFCSNKDDGPANTAMSIWWDRFRVWYNDPGW